MRIVSPARSERRMLALTRPPATSCTWNSMLPSARGALAGLRYRHSRGRCGTSTATDSPGSNASSSSGCTCTTATSRDLRSTESTSAFHEGGVVSSDSSAACTMTRAMTPYASAQSVASSGVHAEPRKVLQGGQQ